MKRAYDGPRSGRLPQAANTASPHVFHKKARGSSSATHRHRPYHSYDDQENDENDDEDERDADTPYGTPFPLTTADGDADGKIVDANKFVPVWKQEVRPPFA